MNNKNNKKPGIPDNIKLITGILLSLLFFYLAARNVNFRQIPGIIAHINFTFYTVSLFIYVGTLFFKAFQVKTMLGFGKDINPLKLISPIIIGYYFNNILPFKAGEVVRSGIISKKVSLPFLSVLSAMFFERTLDVVFILLIALITSFFLKLPSTVFYSIKWFLLVVIILLFLFVILILIGKAKLLKTRKLLPDKINKWVVPYVQTLSEGLWVIRKPDVFIKTFLWGLLIWLMNMTIYWLRFKSFLLPSSLITVAFFMIVVGLGVSVPSAPSYIGVFHLLCVFSLGFFGVGKERAFSFALFSHAFDFLLIAILGNAAIIIEGQSFRRLKLKYRYEYKKDVELMEKTDSPIK